MDPDDRGGDYRTHNFNNLYSGTPSVTDSLVIIGWLDVPSKRAKLSAYTHDGDIAWQQDLGPHVSQHGVSFNPVIYEDYIVINHAHMAGGFTGVYRLGWYSGLEPSTSEGAEGHQDFVRFAAHPGA